MDCKVSGESLIDFHFGKIIPAERTIVETHLAGCPACLNEYFSLKRDIELSAVHDQPSENVRSNIRRDFAEYCASLLSEEKREWLYLHRMRVAVVLSIAAAALLMILFSNQLRMPGTNTLRSNPDHSTEGLRSLDEAVDSGRLSPGHINMI